MKKVGLVLVGFIVLTVGILSVPKREEQKLFIDNGNMEDTSLVFMIQEEDGSYNQSNTLPNSGYTFNASKSVCSNGTIPTWEDNKLYAS